MSLNVVLEATAMVVELTSLDDPRIVYRTILAGPTDPGAGLSESEVQALIDDALAGFGGTNLSDLDPEPPGAASPGTSTEASRSDHVHAPPSPGQIGAATASDIDAAIAALDLGTAATADTTDFDAAGTAASVQTALIGTAPTGGDTLGELHARLAAVEALGSLATDAELVAAVAALIGSADTAGDTLGELQALIGARLLTTNNLSDLTNPGTARTNLGLGTAATQDTTAFDAAGAAAARLAKASNLSDLVDAATARTNLGVRIGTDVQAWNQILADLVALGSTTAFGRNRLKEASGWVPLSDTLVSNGGSGVASLSVSCSGYRFMRFRLKGRSTRTGATTDTLIMTFNSDSNTRYGKNANALGSSFSIITSFTASNTNTDRMGGTSVEIDCGNSSWSTLRWFTNAPSSTATTGVVLDLANGAYTTTTAITSVQLSMANGNIADGSSLIFEGWA